ncbi:hypothetical protein Taro_050282, partial [Colocasia esculenta]|nr:hypothetical protein [Colocasia esculenta]
MLSRALLAKNQITGSIPLSIGYMYRLADLDLSGNRISDGIPDYLGKMLVLSTMLLDNNALSWSIPSALLSSKGLISILNISRNDLDGAIPIRAGELLPADSDSERYEVREKKNKKDNWRNPPEISAEEHGVLARISTEERGGGAEISEPTCVVSASIARGTNLLPWQLPLRLRSALLRDASSLEDVQIKLPRQVSFIVVVRLRPPPNTPPLASQWYRLESDDGAVGGDLMLAIWPGSACKRTSPSMEPGRPTPPVEILPLPLAMTTTGSPLMINAPMSVRAMLGFQSLCTRPASLHRGGSPASPPWNKDLLFVVAEPLSDQVLHLAVELRPGKEPLRCLPSSAYLSHLC